MEKAKNTRLHIIEIAFKEIHCKGFRSASLNNILEKTGLTKGAFYYHFKTKKDLGYAIVDEYIAHLAEDLWLKTLDTPEHPVDQLKKMTAVTRMLEQDIIKYGCPLNNIAVEMAPVDEGFRIRAERIYENWISKIAEALKKGQRANQVRKDINARDTATFIVAALAGCMSLAKNARSSVTLRASVHALEIFLDTLKA